MDTKTVLVILIPSVLSVGLAITSMVLSYLREERHRKDVLWDSAVKLLVSATRPDGEIPIETFAAMKQVSQLQFLYQALGYIGSENGQRLKQLLQDTPLLWPSHGESTPLD